LQQWGIDIIGKLTPEQGNYTFAVVAVDYFTKWIETKPVTNVSSTTTQKKLWQNIICCYRVPKQITFDHTKYFDTCMFKDFYHQVRTNVSFASVYHPQPNGAVEQVNALIFEVIKKILEGEKKGKWAEVTTQQFAESPISRHFNYCLEWRQCYLKKSSTRVCKQQRMHHHDPAKLRRKACWNQMGSKR
jgi:hypothetical protein